MIRVLVFAFFFALLGFQHQPVDSVFGFFNFKKCKTQFCAEGLTKGKPNKQDRQSWGSWKSGSGKVHELFPKVFAGEPTTRVVGKLEFSDTEVGQRALEELKQLTNLGEYLHLGDPNPPLPHLVMNKLLDANDDDVALCTLHLPAPLPPVPMMIVRYSDQASFFEERQLLIDWESKWRKEAESISSSTTAVSAGVTPSSSGSASSRSSPGSLGNKSSHLANTVVRRRGKSFQLANHHYLPLERVGAGRTLLENLELLVPELGRRGLVGFPERLALFYGSLAALFIRQLEAEAGYVHGNLDWCRMLVKENGYVKMFNFEEADKLDRGKPYALVRDIKHACKLSAMYPPEVLAQSAEFNSDLPPDYSTGLYKVNWTVSVWQLGLFIHALVELSYPMGINEYMARSGELSAQLQSIKSRGGGDEELEALKDNWIEAHRAHYRAIEHGFVNLPNSPTIKIDPDAAEEWPHSKELGDVLVGLMHQDPNVRALTFNSMFPTDPADPSRPEWFREVDWGALEKENETRIASLDLSRGDGDNGEEGGVEKELVFYALFQQPPQDDDATHLVASEEEAREFFN